MQQAATWPFVACGTSDSDAAGRGSIDLSFVDDGVGPVVPGSVEGRYGGKAMRTATGCHVRVVAIAAGRCDWALRRSDA